MSLRQQCIVPPNITRFQKTPGTRPPTNTHITTPTNTHITTQASKLSQYTQDTAPTMHGVADTQLSCPKKDGSDGVRLGNVA